MLNIATFNIENLDTSPDAQNPPLKDRIPTLRATLMRLHAQILCLQEVHGQELPQQAEESPKRDLSALDAVITGTPYATFHRCSTLTSGVPYNKRNLVILSKYPITRFAQYRNTYLGRLQYRKVTSSPPDDDARNVIWERPILYALIEHPILGALHVINLHLKSRLASSIPGKKHEFRWLDAASWAEGYFLSSIKRVGQALEVRMLLDSIFDAHSDAKIVVCGDFNAEPGQVPVEAICGRVENTDNATLRSRVMVPCDRTIPESVRFTHLHHGQGNLLDHILISQALLPNFQDAAIHNENLHDESLKFAYDDKFPESDHAAFVARFRCSSGT